jgi:hypothetical protein
MNKNDIESYQGRIATSNKAIEDELQEIEQKKKQL